MTAPGIEAVIELADCDLVPLDREHSDAVVRWRNDPSNSRWFTAKFVFTVEKHEAWLASVRRAGGDFNWAIVERGRGPIGTIGLYNLDPGTRSAEIGRILIGEASARGKGFAKQAVLGVLGQAASHGIARVHLIVYTANRAAIDLYAACGFRHVRDEGDMSVMEWLDDDRPPTP